MKYIFFTFSGHSLPIAKRLIDEGNEVEVGQVSRPEKLNVKGWQAHKETPEEQRRRLSLYDGIIEKQDADKLLNNLRFNKDKEDIFVVLDHNNLCEYGEKLNSMGYIGLIPLREDYTMEKERTAAKNFVEKNYSLLQVPESKEFKKAQDGIDLVEDSDELWVLKSNGNIGDTIVPRTTDTQLNHMVIIGALKCDSKDYEKEGYILERKLRSPIEFTPQLAFWNGEPIYSHVEIECKPIGAGDTGPDGGGALNLVVKTNLDDEINAMFFPPIIFEMAKKRSGLFIFDAGILYDEDDSRFYFTEFAGNRWGWGGIYSELSMATNKNRNATEYFERVSAGKSPLHYKYGATVSLYNILPDKKFASLECDCLPIYWRRAADEYLWLYQIRKNEEGVIVNTGCFKDSILGYASGCGDSLSKCISLAYKVIDNFAFKEFLFRPKGDFLSKDYPSSILNRLEAIKEILDNIEKKEAA
jgi:hypothetical protein